MRTLLHQRFAEALRRCETETRGGQPQWCFEVEGIEPARGIDALDKEFGAWGRDLLFATFEVEDRFRTAAVDLDEMRASTSFVPRGGCRWPLPGAGPSAIPSLNPCVHRGDAEDAEAACADALGNPSDIQFTTAKRPSTGDDVPVCENCEATYGRDAFPDPDTRFKSDEAVRPT